MEDKDVKMVVENLVKWLKEKVADAGAKGLVFGMSGGIDSAVMAGLAKIAFPNDCLGIMMPCHSLDSDEEDARLVAGEVGIQLKKVDLTETYDTLLKSMHGDGSTIAAANIKPRLRMTTLYYHAQTNGYLVAGASNKSEFKVGYFTKHGDSGADILPLADFVKSEIYDIARYIGINEKIINKCPSAGLWEGQTDEDEIGLSYSVIDRYIKTGIVEDFNDKERMDKLFSITEHKRNFPPIFSKHGE